MFSGGERYYFFVPAIVQVEIARTGAGVVDVAEQATGVAVAEKISEVEEVATGAIADTTNEVEEVAAGGVVEMVANGHINVEEEKIDLNNILIYIEAEHTSKFDFMADRYIRSPVATNTDPVIA